MASKRRDSKGRVLRSGESQRRDGMYMYRYQDMEGVRRTVYSWRLVETDRQPAGKKGCAPLREIERRLARDREDGIDGEAARRTTVGDVFQKHMAMRMDLKPTTRAEYFSLYNTHVRDALGGRSVGSVKYSDVKNLLLSLCRDKGLKPGTVGRVQNILHPIFALAVRDGYIRTNPSDGAFAELKRQNHWQQEKRHALTVAQQEVFLNFVRASPDFSYYLNLFTVFLGTGCRAGEIAGLRWEDCDFMEGTISINHSLVRVRREGEQAARLIISTPKTAAGVRTIPMLRAVRAALLDERREQMAHGFTRAEVDGYTGFIFHTKSGRLYTDANMSGIVATILRSYNAKETDAAKKELRKPFLLPHFSIHNLRHTFCVRYCENETNLKVIQEIMGHSSISITMDIYNEATMDQKKASFDRLDDKLKIV